MSPPAAADSLPPRWTLAAAIGISLLAAALRLLPLGESLWLDELHTAWCALAPLNEVAQRAAMGNQAPLFFWLEWLVVRVLGPSELALRLPSLIAGSLLPLALYGVARRWASVLVGLTAAAIIALDPLAIFYATEARPYALVQLLSVIHVGLTAEVFMRPTRQRRGAWILLAAVIFHLHYTAGLLIVAEAVAYVVVLLWCRRDVLYEWRSALLDFVAVMALTLLALGNLQAIGARRANWAEFVAQSDVWQAVVWWPLVAGGLFLAAAALVRRKLSPPQAIALCWAAVPLILAWVATATDVARLFYPRYLLVVQPAAALVGAWCIELAPSKALKWLLAPLLVAAMAIYGGVPQQMATEGEVVAPRGEDWRGAVAWLNQQLWERPFPVLVSSGLIEENEFSGSPGAMLADYLTFPVTSLYPLDVHPDELAPLAVFQDGNSGGQTIEMLMLHRGGAWLVFRGDRDLAVDYATALAAQFGRSSGGAMRWQVTESWHAKRVQVVAIEAAQP